MAAASGTMERIPVDTIAGLIHDTRNMVMALDLYCDLLDEPGVLSASFGHYAGELRLVSGASRRLMERLATLSAPEKRSNSETPLSGQETLAANLLNFPDASKEQELCGSFSTARMRTKTGMSGEIGTPSGAGSEGVPSDSLLSIRRGMPLYTERGNRLDAASGEMARASRHLVEQGAVEPGTRKSGATEAGPVVSGPIVSGPVESGFVESGRAAHWPERRARSRKPLELYMDRRIEDLAAELRVNHNLLSALAGPGVTVSLSISGGQTPIMMAPEDLTRVLVNLVRNAIEAMPGGGEFQISLEEGPQFIALSFADNGPGIPRDVLDRVFSPGYSSHSAAHRGELSASQAEISSGTYGQAGSNEQVRESSVEALNSSSTPKSDSSLNANATSSAWPIQHRGLGLSIVRAIVTAAGGSVWASNRTGNSAPFASPAAAEQGDATSENARAAPLTVSTQETGSCGAVIHIEFPSFGPSPSS